MHDKTPMHLATRCVHAGELDDAQGSPHTPLYTTTTFKFASTEAILDVVEGRAAGSLYTRYGLNPTIQSLEAKLASLEGAEAAFAFCSGMAAETALFLAYGREGVVCIGDAYGGTLELLADQLPLFGIDTHLILGSELDRLEDLLAGGARLVFLETPTNPALEVFDLAAIAEKAHAHGALLAVDNTFASPVNQQPLALGADFAVHSATKYLGGHSDLTAGALMGSQELLAPIFGWRKNLGSMPAPETCNLLARSLRTLVVRVRQQNASAQAVAEAMQRHPRVRRVLYPGLPDFPGHDLAAKQMSGFGGMLTIEVDADTEGTAAVVDRLKLFAIAPSLGGAESLVTQPVTTTHHGLSETERERRGINGAMVRLSVGLEDAEDLIADLEQALSVASG
ncbi:trans-sulfuration enzyme family protein [Thiohalomonas denitrificans]|uniref:Cystathionine gamma-synthase n=1 Tax=Thiohalomonas denitrificans TaxID=415747 RepID=A0A1G5Q8W6_9GAMM|nr:PLP-dependent aspartate aminotransferase family protein [Thiohalomonas denitrificans]SCZ58325.1 cystathionine gamma-synthase [Thiohalomonas denitrificans]